MVDKAFKYDNFRVKDKELWGSVTVKVHLGSVQLFT